MIRVNDDYVIEVDTMNYVAKEDKHKTRVDKNGEEKDAYRTVGYYGTLKGALVGIKEDMFKSKAVSGEISLENALKELKSIDKEFIETFNKVLGE